MTADLLTAIVMVVVAATGAWFCPRAIRMLPEPELDAADGNRGTQDEQDAAVSGDIDAEADNTDPPATGELKPAKPLYADLAARPRLSRDLAVVAGVAAGGIGWSLGPDPALPVLCFLCVVGVVLSYVDWHCRLLPYRLVAPAYPVTIALILLAAVLGRDWEALERAALAWVAVYVVFTLMWLAYRRGLGYGDVRLSGLLAMSLGWLGWAHVVVGLYAAFVVGAVLGIALAAAKIVDRKAYPFGPFLLFGAWLGVLFGSPAAAWLGWNA